MSSATERGPAPPGPKGKPLVGSLPDFSRSALDLFMSGWREYGDVVLFRLGPRKLYLLLNPEHLKHILEDNHLDYPHPEWFDARFRAAAGNGVIAREGEDWRARRQLHESTFDHDRLPPIDAPMVASIADQLDRWQPAAARGAVLDVKDDAYDTSLTLLGRIFLGADWEDHADTIKPSLRIFLQHIDKLLGAPFIVPERVPTPHNRRFTAARRSYDAAVAKAIAARRAGGGDDVLSMLMSLRDGQGRSLSDQDVRDELTNAFNAGWSTIAAAFMWSCYLLGLHPEVADRVRAEATGVLGDRLPTLADLASLPYSRMVTDEILRLYPPLWVGARSNLHADELGGFHIPAGSFINYSSYITHRHPDYWTDPEKFDPDRWTPERGEPRSPHAYLPFSHGPRWCVGDEIARAAVRLFVPMLLRRYRLRTMKEHPIEYTLGITISAKHGVKLVLDEV
jgi:cytochrome P450